MTVSKEKFILARELAAKGRQHAKMYNEDTGCYCASAAIGVAFSGFSVEGATKALAMTIEHFVWESTGDMRDALKLFADVNDLPKGPSSGPAAPTWRVVLWNDDANLTIGDVLAAFDKVIDSLD